MSKPVQEKWTPIVRGDKEPGKQGMGDALEPGKDLSTPLSPQSSGFSFMSFLLIVFSIVFGAALSLGFLLYGLR